MKKSVKVTLIVAAALVGLGLCLSAAGFAMGGRFSDLRNLRFDPATGAWEQASTPTPTETLYTGSDYILPEGTDITALDIDWISGEVEILVTDDSDILVREQPDRETSRSYAMVVTDEGGVLRVRYTSAEFLSLTDLPGKKLTVRLPRAVAENLTEVRLNSVSADFDVAALTVGETFSFASTSGDLETGPITAKNAAAKLSTVSGKIELDGSFHQITGESTSGDYALALRSCPETLELVAVSGSVELKLPDSMDFQLDYSTVSGDLESEVALQHKDGLYCRGTAAGCAITIVTTSGDLDMERLS